MTRSLRGICERVGSATVGNAGAESAVVEVGSRGSFDVAVSSTVTQTVVSIVV